MKKILLSLLTLASSAYATDSVLVFNELQYHPANELTETEWVELRSLQAVDVDISGWRIDGGIDYTFPAGTIMPGGGSIVVAAVVGSGAEAEDDQSVGGDMDEATVDDETRREYLERYGASEHTKRKRRRSSNR